MLILKHTKRQVPQTSRDIDKAKWKGCHSMTLTIETWWILLLLLYFRHIYISIPKGVQQSFPSLSFIVHRNQVKNLQSNHSQKTTVFSSVYTKVFSASALSETQQSNFNCHWFTAFCQTRGKGGMYPISILHFLYTVWSSLRGGLAGCCWSPLEQETEAKGGESKGPACSNSARLAVAGAWRAEHFSQLDPPHYKGAKAISFIFPSDLYFSEGGRKNKGIKDLGLLLMQGGCKSISKLLPLQSPKSFSLLLTQQNWRVVLGSFFWVLVCSDGLFETFF